MTCLQAAQRLADRGEKVVKFAHRCTRTEAEAIAYMDFCESLADMRRVLAKSHYEAIQKEETTL